jgi:coenzyme F420-0:L-glutamate ligase/coenzyme F420-1:gamma-L-glutamate ligase
MYASVSIHAIEKLPMVQSGDDLALLIGNALSATTLSLEDGDVVVVAQKIVSLSENRLVRLDDVNVSPAATDLAAETDKDPRLVELILRESAAVIRKKPGVIIARHRLGLVGANAGVDQSNIDHSKGECALLLPEDPDGSAEKLRQALMEATGKILGIVVSDSMNRPWRLGSIGTAIGSAGITVIDDRCGQPDLFGRELQATVTNQADAIAAAATLVMGESTERVPAVIVRGLAAREGGQTAHDCVRPVADDLFL